MSILRRAEKVGRKYQNPVPTTVGGAKLMLKALTMMLASREERYSTTNNSYTNAYANLGFASAFPVAVPSATTFNYALAVTAAGTSTFTITATPNGDQVNDTCGTYQLTEQGVQSNTGATTDSATCWR